VHRKRAAHKRRQPFDYVVYFFTVATPLFELPQAISIFHNHDASSVSASTWMFFVVSSVVFTLYAIRERLKPLIVAYSLYTIVESIIVVGIILYE
jgi:uncharacterized protein with PQ loop repeat